MVKGIHSPVIRSVLTFLVVIGVFTAFLWALGRILVLKQSSLGHYLFIVEMSLALFWSIILLIEQVKGGFLKDGVKTVEEKSKR